VALAAAAAAVALRGGSVASCALNRTALALRLRLCRCHEQCNTAADCPSASACVATQAAAGRRTSASWRPNRRARRPARGGAGLLGRFAVPDGVHLRCGLRVGDFCVLSGAPGPATSLRIPPTNQCSSRTATRGDGAVLDGPLLSEARRARRWTQSGRQRRRGDASQATPVSRPPMGSTDSTVTDGPGSSPATGAFPRREPVDRAFELPATRPWPRTGHATTAETRARTALRQRQRRLLVPVLHRLHGVGHEGLHGPRLVPREQRLQSRLPVQPTARRGKLASVSLPNGRCPIPGPSRRPAAGGATQPRPFSTDTASGTVTDQVSGLIWQLVSPVGGCSAADAAASCTLSDAVAYCASLTLAGSSDWRVPRIELETLLDYSHAQRLTSRTRFCPTQAASRQWRPPYWTASRSEETSLQLVRRILVTKWELDLAAGGSLGASGAPGTGSATTARPIHDSGGAIDGDRRGVGHRDVVADTGPAFRGSG